MEENAPQKETHIPQPPLSKPTTPMARAILRTLQTDTGVAVKASTPAIVRAVMVQEKEREAVAEIVSPTSKKNITYIVISGLLFLVGVGLLVYVLYPRQTSVSFVKTGKVSSIVVADTAESLHVDDGRPDDVKKSIAQKLATLGTPENGVSYLAVTTRAVTGEYVLSSTEFISRIGTRETESLVPLLIPRFMVGRIATPTGSEPFLLFETTEFVDAANAMRIWETKLFDDMYGLFGISIEGNNASLFNTSFTGEVIANKYVRVLKNTEGTPVLIYGFIDDNTIMVTTNQNAAEALVARLFAKRSE